VGEGEYRRRERVTWEEGIDTVVPSQSTIAVPNYSRARRCSHNNLNGFGMQSIPKANDCNFSFESNWFSSWVCVPIQNVRR